MQAVPRAPGLPPVAGPGHGARGYSQGDPRGIPASRLLLADVILAGLDVPEAGLDVILAGLDVNIYLLT